MPFGSKPNNPILLMLAGGASLNVGLRIWFDIAWVPDPHWRASSYHLDVTSSAFCFKPRGFLGPRDSAHGLWALNTSQVCQKRISGFCKSYSVHGSEHLQTWLPSNSGHVQSSFDALYLQILLSMDFSICMGSWIPQNNKGQTVFDILLHKWTKRCIVLRWVHNFRCRMQKSNPMHSFKSSGEILAEHFAITLYLHRIETNVFGPHIYNFNKLQSRCL